MLDKLKQTLLNYLQPKAPPALEIKPEPKIAAESASSSESSLSEKDAATQAGRPWVNVISFELDPTNIHAGAFELDWNELWVAKLIRAGYKIRDDDTDQDIVDRWFTDICRNIVREIFEQEAADPQKREIVYKETRVPGSKDIGGGRREIS